MLNIFDELAELAALNSIGIQYDKDSTFHSDIIETPIGHMSANWSFGYLTNLSFLCDLKDEKDPELKKNLKEIKSMEDEIKKNRPNHATVLRNQLSEYFSGKRKEFDFNTVFTFDNILHSSSPMERYLEKILDEEFDPIPKEEKDEIENNIQPAPNDGRIYISHRPQSNVRQKVLDFIISNKVPYGELVSYKGIAEDIGTKSYQAVGTALGLNEILIIHPCHRVIKADGSYGNYQGGEERKRFLIELEKEYL